MYSYELIKLLELLNKCEDLNINYYYNKYPNIPNDKIIKMFNKKQNRILYNIFSIIRYNLDFFKDYPEFIDVTKNKLREYSSEVGAELIHKFIPVFENINNLCPHTSYNKKHNKNNHKCCSLILKMVSDIMIRSHLLNRFTKN